MPAVDVTGDTGKLPKMSEVHFVVYIEKVSIFVGVVQNCHCSENYSNAKVYCKNR